MVESLELHETEVTFKVCYGVISIYYWRLSTQFGGNFSVEKMVDRIKHIYKKIKLNKIKNNNLVLMGKIRTLQNFCKFLFTIGQY